MVDEVCPGVFRIPALTKDFCEEIVSACDGADWQGSRHLVAPTYDSLLKDVSADLHNKFLNLLEEYFHPLVKYCMDYAPAGKEGWENKNPSFKELSEETFIAKFSEKDSNLSHLKIHHDGENLLYTLNILLNDDFEGGGTFFAGNHKFNGHLIKPDVGDLLFHPSNTKYPHGSRPVLSGTRYILVSFVSISECQAVVDKDGNISYITS
jgi:hypothetical protein